MAFINLNKKFFLSFIFLSFFHIICLPCHAGKNGLNGDEEDSLSRGVTQSLSFKHLSTSEDHQRFLMDTFRIAQKSVMISSYNLDPHLLFSQAFTEVFNIATEKGVKIYIYYQNRPMLSHQDYVRLKTLEETCQRFEQNTTHSKCLLRDNECVAIGSYDWLSSSRPGSLNASWVMSGDLAAEISQQIWSVNNFHQSLAYENQRGVSNFFRNKDNFSVGYANLDRGQSLSVMGTPEAHHQFLKEEVFEIAQKEIVLCSPFIRLERIQDVLSASRLRDLKKRNISLSLVTLPNPCSRTPHEKSDIFSYLDDLKRTFSNFSYKIHKNLHAKSISIDGELLLEGSFNFLSAVDTSLHEANNNEFSLALKGDVARVVIQSLQQDPQWRKIFPKTVSPISSLQKRKYRENSGKDPKRGKPTPSRSFQDNHRDVQRVETFSGKRFGENGYCARIDGNEYVMDERNEILYFPTPEEARQIAYKVLAMEEEESEDGSSEKLVIPQHFVEQLHVYPDNRGHRGFCVRRFGNYIKDGRGIAYFSTPEDAISAAWNVWGT